MELTGENFPVVIYGKFNIILNLVICGIAK